MCLKMLGQIRRANIFLTLAVGQTLFPHMLQCSYVTIVTNTQKEAESRLSICSQDLQYDFRELWYGIMIVICSSAQLPGFPLLVESSGNKERWSRIKQHTLPFTSPCSGFEMSSHTKKFLRTSSLVPRYQ